MTLSSTSRLVAALSRWTTVRDLSADLALSRRAIERQLAALREAGIRIERRRDKQDARIVWIRMAPRR